MKRGDALAKAVREKVLQLCVTPGVKHTTINGRYAAILEDYDPFYCQKRCENFNLCEALRAFETPRKEE